MTREPLFFSSRWVLAKIRWLALFVLLPVMTAGPATAGAGRELRNDVIGVIKNQIEAFQRDDGQQAFALTSPDVQEQFGSSEAYLSKYSTSYKAVYRPRSVTFLNLAFSRGRLVQRVLLQGPDCGAVVALFPMIRMDDGTWRIDGCVLVPATGNRAENDPKPVPDPETMG